MAGGLLDVSVGCKGGLEWKVVVGLGEVGRGEDVSGSFASREMRRSKTAVDSLFLLLS